MTEKNLIKAKGKKPIWAIIFFVITLGATLGMYFYNIHLEKVNIELLTKIEARENDIQKNKKNKKIQIFSLLENNKTFIEELIKRSEVTKYINHLKAISQKYNLKFEWFKLSKGNIKTSITIESTEDGGIAYMKTRDFIRNYRLEKNSLFELEFINSIEWMDSMKFNASFNIK